MSAPAASIAHSIEQAARWACLASGASSAIKRNCDLVSGFVRSGEDRVSLLRRALVLNEKARVALIDAIDAAEEAYRMEAENAAEAARKVPAVSTKKRKGGK